jgi:glycerol-3-phosphate dehydrogenase (NAD(P)+)
MATVAVLGAGRMGTALCAPLLERGHRVRLVGTHLDRDYIEALRSTGVHPGLLHPLPPGGSFQQFEELADALDGADRVAIGVNSQGVEWAAAALAPHLRPGTPLLMVTKGIAWSDGAFALLPDILVAGLPEAIRSTIHPVAITGPCVAGELVRGNDTCVVFASRDENDAKAWADLARTSCYHVWTSGDLVACEWCAALKNAYAIGVGIAQGLHTRRGGDLGHAVALQGVATHNLEAGVFSQASIEMTALVRLAGGDPALVAGLPGVGDLFVTCYARNLRLGQLLGSGLGIEDAVARMEGATLEGLDAVRAVGRALPSLEAAGRITANDLPLLRHLLAIVDEGATVAIPFDRFAALAS